VAALAAPAVGSLRSFLCFFEFGAGCPACHRSRRYDRLPPGVGDRLRATGRDRARYPDPLAGRPAVRSRETPARGGEEALRRCGRGRPRGCADRVPCRAPPPLSRDSGTGGGGARYLRPVVDPWRTPAGGPCRRDVLGAGIGDFVPAGGKLQEPRRQMDRSAHTPAPGQAVAPGVRRSGQQAGPVVDRARDHPERDSAVGSPC
jgi:hypothetical protein